MHSNMNADEIVKATRESVAGLDCMEEKEAE